MNSYETYIGILENIATEIGCSFFHSRYEDLNTFQGDFPLILCLPLRYDITNTGGNIYAGGFDTSLVFFIKSDDNLDRTQQTDLARIYLCDALVSKFVLKLQQIQGLTFDTAQAQAYPLENSSSFVLTAITLNFKVKTSYLINYCE